MPDEPPASIDSPADLPEPDEPSTGTITAERPATPRDEPASIASPADLPAPDEPSTGTRTPERRATPRDEPTVRLATPEDIPGLAELAALTFPLACPPSITPADAAAFAADRLSPGAFATYLADPARQVLVAADETGALIGYTLLVFGEPYDEDAAATVTIRPTAELSKCYVHPDRHGAGTAAALMSASLDLGRRLGAAGMWLGVNQHNARAQRFYAKSGFAVVGVKHFTVGTVREDDYVMERPL